VFKAVYFVNIIKLSNTTIILLFTSIALYKNDLLWNIGGTKRAPIVHMDPYRKLL
jgi:hypothetical protein